MEQWLDLDPGSGIKHPGSATLALAPNLDSKMVFKKIFAATNLHELL
jgi:hypothetical protein